MKIKRNKTEATTIALLLTLTIIFSLIALPIVTAHDPPKEIPTYAYISINPNPIGVDQTATVVFWVAAEPSGYPATASGVGGYRWTDMKVKVTMPDGDEKEYGPFTSDPTGSSYTSFTPDQVGTYTFDFYFPEQVLSLYHPETGVEGSPSEYINDTYLSSSASTTLTVQEDKIPSPPTYPLPTEYWTRPIEGQNTEWYKVASNWLSGSHIAGKIQPDGAAPNSPHVMWTKPLQFGGVVGGSRTGAAGMTYYDGTAYEGKAGNLIILQGRLYYNLPESNSGSGGGYVCVDLQTGEEIYYKDMNMPSFGQLYDYESPNQHGVIPNGYLWSTVGGGFWGPPTPQNWSAYNPIDGDWLFDLQNVPPGTEVYGPNGEILRYVLNAQDSWLALWNNTAAHGLTGARDPTDTTSSSYIQWRPLGKEVDASQAYSWNVSVPWLPDGASILSVIHDDILIGMNGSFPSGIDSYPYTMWAINLTSESRGEQVWMKTYEPPSGGITRGVGPLFMGMFLDPDTRVFLKYDKETIAWSGYSLDNGTHLWGPTPSEHDLNYYSDVGLTRYAVAYGKLYSTSYSGIVYCYDLKNGTLLWTYKSPSGLASPYPNWPLGIGAIADEKVYLFTTEHSANAPHWVGVKMHCIDAITGDKIWTLDSYGCQNSMAIADGYLVYLNLYDMQIYSIGKGPSATTVEAPDTGIPLGSSVTIRGTVIDTAAGTKQKEQAGRFPHGVPAMSDDSMKEWMEYVYMQKPQPEDAEGVRVTLDAINPSGEFVHIGETTSDMSGTYSYVWQPEMEGKYTVIATFEGSDSYWPSWDETAISVDPAPDETVSPTEQPAWYEEPPETVSPTEQPAWYEEPPETVSPTEQPTWYQKPDNTLLIIAIVIAIVIGLVNLWMHMKQPK